MAGFELAGTWDISVPPDEVWEVMSDLSCWRQWWPAMRDAEEVGSNVASGTPGEVRMTFDAPSPLKQFHVEAEITEVTPPRRLRVASARGGLQGEGELEVTERDGGSRVRYGFHVRTTKFWLRPIEVVLRRAGQRAGRERLAQAGQDLARMAGGELDAHDVTTA